MSEHPSLTAIMEKDASEKKRLKELLEEAEKPLDLAEVNDKLKRIVETQSQTKQKLIEVLDGLSQIDEKELELLDLMIRKYKKQEG